MQYQFVANNHSRLHCIVAPAFSTNACSVLALGTSNRLGRVVVERVLVASDIAASKRGRKVLWNGIPKLRALEIPFSHAASSVAGCSTAALGLVRVVGIDFRCGIDGRVLRPEAVVSVGRSFWRC